MDEARFRCAIEAFDRANAEDPNQELSNGVLRPKELVDAERLSAWVDRLDPNASEALRLAARCQHIRRWELARSSFSNDRIGYLKWRTELARFHAETAARLLEAAGYDAVTIDAVRRINVKQGLHSNPDTQTMEDALCLTFLEHEFEAFAEKHSDEKLVNILQKTWKKMSPRGQSAAEKLALSSRARALLARALGRTDPS
jgi:Domain of unknown function (DUF4202)